MKYVIECYSSKYDDECDDNWYANDLDEAIDTARAILRDGVKASRGNEEWTIEYQKVAIFDNISYKLIANFYN